MNFMADPGHVWMAVLVMAGTIAACTAMFAMVVKVLLDQFLRAQRDILTAATIQADSLDTSLSLQNSRLEMLDGRVTKLEAHRHEHANLLVAHDERLRRIEPPR